MEDARVIVIGLGVFKIMKTNIGGWWNITKKSQRNGTYFIVVLKNGYRPVLQSVTYAGEPLQETIEARSR